MRTVEFYRKKAEECRDVARQIYLREAREKLLDMAREWAHAEERLAIFKTALPPQHLQNYR